MICWTMEKLHPIFFWYTESFRERW